MASSESSRRVVALVAAAGQGTRLGAQLPKAYVLLRGRSLVARSVQAMITSAIVDEVIVIVSPDMEGLADRLLRSEGLFDAEIPVRIVHGGAERADSVWCGLQAIDDDDAVVLIHDAARALTPPGMIARVARAVLEGADAVIPVLPVADTIKRVDANDIVVETPNRAELRAVQTPQGFDLHALRQANLRYLGEQPGFVPTDDASLMEWAGSPVHTVQGDPMALKITTPIDYVLAKAVTDEAEPTIFEVP